MSIVKLQIANSIRITNNVHNYDFQMKKKQFLKKQQLYTYNI